MIKPVLLIYSDEAMKADLENKLDYARNSNCKVFHDVYHAKTAKEFYKKYDKEFYEKYRVLFE